MQKLIKRQIQKYAQCALGILLLIIALPGFAKQYVVGFAQSDTAESDWRRANTESFQAAAAELKIKLLFKDAGGKTEAQKKHVTEFIEQKVDAIVIAANDVKGWDEVLLKAKAAKIPVVLSDRTVTLKPENQDKGLYVSWVGSDFRYEGRVAAAWLAQATAGNCNIVEIAGPLDTAPAIERGKGFRELAALFPNMKIIASETAGWREEKAKSVMKKILHEEGANICAVYAHNDNMAFGAVAAIEEDKKAGLVPGKDILIIGVDAVRRGFELMVNKKINALVECNPLLGKVVLRTVLEVLEGKRVPTIRYTDEKVYTQSNAKEMLPTRKY